MFFALSKTVGFLMQPSNFIALLCAVGLVLMITRWRRCGLRLLAGGVALLLLFGYSPAGHILMLPLTERFPAWVANDRAPDGIIVLGGAIDPDVSAARGHLEVDSSAERVLTMLQLARRFPEAKIVFSGGSGSLISGGVAEAPLAARLLQEFDVNADRIIIEEHSRSTAENAAMTRALVQPKPGERWLLVTSAFHMPRSVGSFRAAGFEVEAFPVDWRTSGWDDAFSLFRRLSAGLARTDVAIHEWVGLLAYRLIGRTSELFPKP